MEGCLLPNWQKYSSLPPNLAYNFSTGQQCLHCHDWLLQAFFLVLRNHKQFFFKLPPHLLWQHWFLVYTVVGIWTCINQPDRNPAFGVGEGGGRYGNITRSGLFHSVERCRLYAYRGWWKHKIVLVHNVW